MGAPIFHGLRPQSAGFTRGYIPKPRWGELQGTRERGAHALCTPHRGRAIEHVTLIKLNPMSAEQPQEFCFEVFFFVMRRLIPDVLFDGPFLRLAAGKDAEFLLPREPADLSRPFSRVPIDN